MVTTVLPAVQAPARLAPPILIRPASDATPELAEARIDVAAIAANARWFLDRAEGAALMAVVKADGFGHGAVPVSHAALDAGAAWLGVARLREGLSLRAAGVAAPILAWLLEPAWVRDAVERRIDLAASSVADLDRIAGSGAARRAEVQLKLDTGLHRAGATMDEWPAVVAHAARLEHHGRIHVRGIWSHLSHGDVPGDPRTPRQARTLATGIDIAHAAGLRPEVTHLANSGGVIQAGRAGCSMVRVGAGLYGIEVMPPADRTKPAQGASGLRPAMRVVTRVVGVRSVAAGEGVGYGHATVIPRATCLALVPMGYADGLPRIAGPHARMLVGDRVARVVGRISMDQAILDVGVRPVRIGDPVTVIGDGRDEAPIAADWARWSGTIPHEILTGIGARVVRRCVDGAR